MVLTYKVEKENLSVNQILKNELKISSRLFYKLIKNHLVYINGKVCDTRSLANIGDLICVDLNYVEDNSNVVAKKMDLDIIYEDEWFIVLNKPSGIAVHPSILHFEDSLSNGLKFYFDSIGLKKRIRPVNRLDFYTSGLIVFAKNEYVQECLIKQMADNTFHKEYLAVVTGVLDVKKGTIDKPIGRKDGSIIERCVTPDGKRSVTHFEVLKEFDGFSLIKCLLETGRTHQIRVHFASIGHPLVGDELYGEKSNLVDGQALVCCRLCFKHPISKVPLCFELEGKIFSFIDILGVGY